jgi:hypothetical protein
MNDAIAAARLRHVVAIHDLALEEVGALLTETEDRRARVLAGLPAASHAIVSQFVDALQIASLRAVMELVDAELTRSLEAVRTGPDAKEE